MNRLGNLHFSTVIASAPYLVGKFVELEIFKLFHPKSPLEFRLVPFYIFSIFPHLSKSQATLKKIFFLKAKVAFFPRSFRPIPASKVTDQTV